MAAVALGWVYSGRGTSFLSPAGKWYDAGPSSPEAPHSTRLSAVVILHMFSAVLILGYVSILMELVPSGHNSSPVRLVVLNLHT